MFHEHRHGYEDAARKSSNSRSRWLDGDLVVIGSATVVMVVPVRSEDSPPASVRRILYRLCRSRFAMQESYLLIDHLWIHVEQLTALVLFDMTKRMCVISEVAGSLEGSDDPRSFDVG